MLSPTAFLFGLKAPEELHLRVRVVAGTNQVLSRQAVGALFLGPAEAGAHHPPRQAASG
jgi:hypothetical protein